MQPLFGYVDTIRTERMLLLLLFVFVRPRLACAFPTRYCCEMFTKLVNSSQLYSARD